MAIALYRRYRPESFAEVIGQDHVTTPLRRALRAGRVGHAYLFSGPRGCGKTTSARILARCLNCAEGPTDIPCGTCDSCRDLATGGAGSLDVVEIDAASHGGVDDARELRERASFAPVRDRYKVFIIDEAHMVTSAGFNALLKLVEEPPDHVKFVFATTEPDKVIGTIRSRTHHYPFRLIPPQVLGPYLEEVCVSEGMQVGAGVMPLVVRAGGGSARDSMSVLDQLMAGAAEDGLDVETAIALLGFTDSALLDSAITAVAERDAASLYGAVEHVLATGHEPRRFVEDLLERMRDLIVLAAVPDRGADLLPQIPAGDLERMRGQAALFSPADLSQCGDLVHETLSTMSGATSPRLHLELLAARLVLRDERAALAAGDGGAPAGGRPGAGPTGHGGQPGGAPQGPRGGESAQTQSSSGASAAREEARRIAQQKAESARQSRGGGAPAPTESRERYSAAPEAPTGQPEPGRQDPASAGQGPAQWAPSAGAATAAAAATSAPEAPAPQTRDPQTPAPQSPAPEAQGQTGAVESQRGPSAATAPTGQDQAPASQQPASTAQQTAQEQGQDTAPQQAAPAAPAGGGLDAETVRGHWSAILDELQQIRRPSWALISQNGHVHGTQGATLVIGFRTEGLVNAFRRGTAAENLADAVRRILHAEVSIDAVVGEDPGPSGDSGPSGGGGGGTGGGVPGMGGPAAQQSGAPQNEMPRGTAQQGGGQFGGAPRDAAPPSGAPRDDAGQADAPRSSVQWGDAVAAMAPRAAAPSSPSSARPAPEQPPASVGQRASERAMQAAARAAQNNAGAGRAAPVEDFAPEPDDPYPPDPEDSYVSSDRAPQAAGARWSDALDQAPPTAGRGTAPAAGGVGFDPAAETNSAPATGASNASATLASTAPAAPVADGEIPVVEDEGRDTLPEEEPRTYGQNALKRAIAEGRLIRSRPSEAAAAASKSAPGAAAAESFASGIPMPADVPPAVESPASPASPSPAPGATAPQPASETSTSGQWGDAVQGSASERAAASWGSTPSVTTSTPDPGQNPAPSGRAGLAPAAPAPAASASEPPAPPAAPRTGAALAREAAQASRTANLRGRGQLGGVPEQAPGDVDPTGGATRDDEDAVVANRNGREVIEKMLGGKVLEVIDEGRQA